jgi:hypothetical protein
MMGQSLYCWRARAAKSQNEKCKKQNDRAKIKILNASDHACGHDTRSIIWNQYHNTAVRVIAAATCCNNFSVLL